MKRRPGSLCLFLFVVFSALTASASPVSIRVLPETPLLVQSREGQSVHCEFVVKNDSDVALSIDTIEVSVMGPGGTVIFRRFVNSNGMPGGIRTLPVREVAPHAELVVFNPLHSFDSDLKIASLQFRFLFNEGEQWRKHAVQIEVRPRPWRSGTRLVLPLQGRVLVHDGHDFLSHHRRFDVTHPFARKVGVTGVSGRYAYDFVVVRDDGRMFSGSGTRVEEWFGWNAPVRATGDGVVVAAAGDIADNAYGDGDPGHAGPESSVKMDASVTMEKPLTIAGNYVVIDHGNGEWSLLAHLKRGSVSVKAGDRVRAGQVIGAMGMSGDSMIPHVHYQLQNGPDLFRSEGLPSRFEGLRRAVGSGTVRSDGVVDSGDIVLAKR